MSPQNPMAAKIKRLLGSRLSLDSLWSVFGNGMGYGLLLIAGILIARRLGSDIYGEYGLVKTTMIYIAGFATLGLGLTSTKYISAALADDPTKVRSLAKDAMVITFAFSFTLAVLLAIFAAPLAQFLDTPSLTGAFRVLAIIIICKAMNTTQNGILAGFGLFRIIARNSILSGALMLALCVPLTIKWGLNGAFGALTASQLLNAILNQIYLSRCLRQLRDQVKISQKKELVLFSCPIALQELNYTICAWGAMAILTKLSNVGQVGIYTATAQWVSIITFIPGLLQNVILSHLSGSINNAERHSHTLRTMLAANFISTAIPFVVIFFLAGWISTFYGNTFSEMASVMRVMTFSTIFSACSNVFYSELLSQGHNWLTLVCRLGQEITLLVAGWLLLIYPAGRNGAMSMGIAYLCSAVVSFLLPFTSTLITNRTHRQCQPT